MCCCCGLEDSGMHGSMAKKDSTFTQSRWEGALTCTTSKVFLMLDGLPVEGGEVARGRNKEYDEIVPRYLFVL